MSEQFDPERFQELAAKAENDSLTEEEAEEVKAQVEHFQSGISGLVDAMRVPMNAIGETITEFARIMGDGQHPRVAEIAANHRQRHDHTAETPRCECGAHLPKLDAGHNRTMCANCGEPQTYWVE